MGSRKDSERITAGNLTGLFYGSQNNLYSSGFAPQINHHQQEKVVGLLLIVVIVVIVGVGVCAALGFLLCSKAVWVHQFNGAKPFHDTNKLARVS